MRNLQRWQIYIANRVLVNAGVVNQMIKYFDGVYLTDEKDVILERYEEVNNLLKTRDAKALYEKYGFEECKAICMVQKRN